MKTLLIVSGLTFVLIFGGVALLAIQVSRVPAAAASGETAEADQEASARVLRDLQAERDRIQREKEGLATLRQSYAVQEQVLTQTYARMQELFGGVAAGEQARTAEQEAAGAKLAKMYEAMPPAKAAPILAALAPEVTLDILRRMKPRQAAALLANMDAKIAAQISTRLSLKEE
jgi:flagellar motility protein MotE (MotC chaperone)